MPYFSFLRPTSGALSFSTHPRIFFSSEYFHYKIFIHEKFLRKLKWQIPGEPLAVRHNWCQDQVPGRSPAVKKYWPRYRWMHDIKISFEDTGIPLWSKFIIPVAGSCELHTFWDILNYCEFNGEFNDYPSEGLCFVPITECRCNKEQVT